MGVSGVHLDYNVRKRRAETFAITNRTFHETTEPIEETGCGEVVAGRIEFWRKRVGEDRRITLLQSLEYVSKDHRAMLMATWNRKYSVHLYKGNFYYIIKPTLPIDEEIETEPITQSQKQSI